MVPRPKTGPVKSSLISPPTRPPPNFATLAAGRALVAPLQCPSPARPAGPPTVTLRPPIRRPPGTWKDFFGLTYLPGPNRCNRTSFNGAAPPGWISNHGWW